MLQEMRILDFALIRDLRIEFGAGFNVVTGETGAGKSIIIDALAFLLGARAQSEQLRSGAAEAVVTGSFDLPPSAEFGRILEVAGLTQETDQFLLVKRHLLRDGKSKAYVNGTLLPLSSLRQLGDWLVDIQGQHQGQSLLEPRRQLELLDAHAGHAGEVKQLQALYQRIQGFDRELAEARGQQGDAAARRALLDFQRKEIAAARLRTEEETEIAEEMAILSHAEKLLQWCEGALDKLSDAPGSAADSLAAAIASLKAAREVDPRFASPLEALELAAIHLEEASSFLQGYRGRIDFDPARLEELEVRASVIAKLKRKYGESIAEVLAQYERILQEIGVLEGLAEREAHLSDERARALAEMGELAGRISQARRKSAGALAEEAERELRQLGLPHVIFRIELSAREDPEGELMVGPGRYPASPRGIDEASFLFSANPGEPVRPLAKIISGGELSRVVLALKTVLAAWDEIPTLILDEVDAGISGSMGEIIGRKLSSLGEQRQVICITHLPQIAAYGDAHLTVQKVQEADRTGAMVQRLDGEGRVREIARMLGDKGVTKTPVRHAGEILSQAREWKRREHAPLATA